MDGSSSQPSGTSWKVDKIVTFNINQPPIKYWKKRKNSVKLMPNFWKMIFCERFCLR